MVLKCLKARTGITEAGDRYLLERNSEDLSLNIQQYNGLNDGIEGLKKTERRVWDKLLQMATKLEDALSIKRIGEETGLTRNRSTGLCRGWATAGLRVMLEADGRGRRSSAFWIDPQESEKGNK